MYHADIHKCTDKHTQSFAYLECYLLLDVHTNKDMYNMYSVFLLFCVSICVTAFYVFKQVVMDNMFVCMHGHDLSCLS